MKVLLVGNFARDKQFSMLGFGNFLVDGLNGTDIETEFVAPAPVVSKLVKIPGSKQRFIDYIDKYILFPRQLKRKAKDCDLVHVLDQGNGMYLSTLKDFKTMVTVHDVLAIRAARNEIDYWQIGASGKKYQSLITEGLTQADKAVCVSENTRRELLEIVNKPEHWAEVIPNAIYRPIEKITGDKAETYLKQAGIKKPYLLHVGGNQPYKNRAGVIEAFAALEKAESERFDYVMAGKALPQNLQERVQRLGLENRIKRLDMPTDEQINILYSNAEALVYPSLTEGFGLPIIEAATVDCPVITSNRPPMSEIVEPQAPKFDPTSPDDIAITVLEALKDRDNLIELGRRSLQRFKREDVLRQYIELYRSLAG